MANKTSAQPSFIQEDSEVDECNENIAPGDLVGHSSKPRSREIREAEDKPWTSGVQSALTPVLRSLNISNKCPSPEPLKHKGNLHVNSPCMPSNLTMANSQKSATSVSSIPSLFDFYSKRFGRAVGDKEASLYLLENEYMPEVTLFDVTCDSTMELTRNYLALPDSVPATPITPAKQSGTVAQRITSESYQNSDKEQHKSETCLPKVSKHNGTASGTNLNAKIVGTPSRASAPEWWLDLPEITLLDVTCDSGPSPGGEVSSVGISRNVSPADSLKDNTPSLELTTTQPGRSDGSQIEFSNTLYASATHPLTSCSEKSDSAGETAGKTSLIQDVSMDSVSEKSRTSPEPSKRNMAKNQTSPEDTQVTHPADVTHDTSSSPCTSAVSQLLTFDMQRNASSKTVPSEQHSGHVETLDIVDAKNQLLNSDDVQKADKMLQPSPETDGSANSTFTIAPPSNLSTSTISNTTIQKPSSQNKTLDLSTGTVSSANADIDTRDQANSVSETPEISLPKNQNLSADKASGSCGVQNATFDQALSAEIP
ncbi:hypothetical protein Q5P01_023291 [Channa striata]|uniref:Uncharacterized protein n=1 Tax=Channa striata TaxID=64152 RepID=A0AA88IW28_CHASR|nr:hypothetical protein Q5P01_023291 [Channa striata]